MKHALRCIAFGCTNPVVRELVHQVSPAVRFGVCAFHGLTVIKHGTEEQVRYYLFPEAGTNGGNS